MKCCLRCGKPLTGRRHHLRKYCVGGCRWVSKNERRRQRYTRKTRRDDIPDAEIERLFQLAKAAIRQRRLQQAS